MAVNEKTALKLTYGDKPYFFCSEHCMKKFAQENNIPEEEVISCLCQQKKAPLYKNKTFTLLYAS